MNYVEFPDNGQQQKGSNDDNNRPTRSANGGGPWLWGLVFAMLFLLFLNVIISPAFMRKHVIETDYGTFVSKVEQDSITEVVIQDSRIIYSTEKQIYSTGIVDDPNLVDRLLAADSPNDDGKIHFVKKIENQRSPIAQFLMWWILPGLFFWIFYRAIMKRMAKGGKSAGGLGMGNFMSFGQSGAKVYADTDVKTRFDDVAGQDEAKASLQEMVDFLHNPKKYTALGAKLPKGALLVGPPGTGKTLIARAVAGEAGVPFFSMSGSEFVQMFVGMGAAKVRDLFNEASKKAPCIIFIDEIDAIGKSREGRYGGANNEREQTLNQLLTEMDGFDGDKGVIILAATNRPDSLDKALLRPGRFDRRIQMELPDLEGRKAIINVHLKNVQHEVVDLDVVARATAGSSGADLANIVNEAALRAVRQGKNAVTTEDIEESVETVMAGEQRKNAVISPEEKRIIAYHEVGHAMVAAAQTNSAPVHKITIIPRTSGALGYTMQVDEGEHFLYSRQYLLNKLATLTGGRVAEETICNTCTTGASNDIEQATQLARSMITRYGMSDRYGMMALETQGNAYLGGNASLACSDKTAADIDTEVQRLIADAKDKAAGIISSRIDKMHEVAEYLLERETITGEEFMKILEK